MVSEFSPEFLEEEILDLVKENGLDTTAARVKFSAYRKEGGYYKPATREIGFIITAKELSDAFYLLNEDDYEVELFKESRDVENYSYYWLKFFPLVLTLSIYA